jgi:hypothetical protein
VGEKKWSGLSTLCFFRGGRNYPESKLSSILSYLTFTSHPKDYDGDCYIKAVARETFRICFLIFSLYFGKENVIGMLL